MINSDGFYKILITHDIIFKILEIHGPVLIVAFLRIYSSPVIFKAVSY